VCPHFFWRLVTYSRQNLGNGLRHFGPHQNIDMFEVVVIFRRNRTRRGR
jgi:hypothetical protein